MGEVSTQLMSFLLGMSLSWICGRWKVGILPAPARRFLRVVIELQSEQVIALTVIGECQIAGTVLSWLLRLKPCSLL